jgi:hypothetical protein
VSRRAPLLYIGANVESIREYREAIMAILGAPKAAEATKQTALTVLGQGVTTNASISNCTLTGSLQ